MLAWREDYKWVTVDCLCALGIGVTIETERENDIIYGYSYISRIVLQTLTRVRSRPCVPEQVAAVYFHDLA